MKGSRDMPQIKVRLPKDLKDWLSEQAEKNYRSMSSEVARRLDESRRMDCDKEAA